MSDENRPSVDERLAALEERTTPKPKTLTDRVKDWAGVGTLAIALLYTFPLGVWDRFFVTEHQQRQKETDELRSLIVKLAEKDADLARAYFSITNEQVRAFFLRAMASMKSAIISQGYKIIDSKRYIDLTTSELILLGYYLGQAGKIDNAEHVYKIAAIRSESEKNINFQSEVYRQLGALHSGNISKIELDKVRENFNQAVKVLVETPTAPYLLQASNTAFEWATLEMAYGDWSCGQTLADWAIRTVGDLPPINPDFATYAAQYQSQKTRFVKRPGQPDQGCPKQQADWARS